MRAGLYILVFYNILIVMMNERLAKQAEAVSAVLKHLGHPTRLKVLCCMLDSEKSVNELSAYSGASQSWVSQFLARMKFDGLVASRKEGTFVYYRISEQRLKGLMKAIYETYCSNRK